MAVLGLRFCARAFSSCGKWGPLFIAVRGPLTIAASLVAEHRLQTRRLSSCGSRAQLHRGMWDLPRPGLEPAFPALAGRFSTTVPPGKPCSQTFNNKGTIFNMGKYTWLSPDLNQKKHLAQQCNHTALYRTFHRSTQNTFEHKNEKYLKRISKQYFISAKQTYSTD